LIAKNLLTISGRKKKLMKSIKKLFMLDPNVVFLNHGSFGACPIPVFKVYQEWQRKLERQPVAFIASQLENRLRDARMALGRYIQADAENIVFVPNATFGVNVIARSLSLGPGDVVLATDHEYGACNNAWKFVCGNSGAIYQQQRIPFPSPSPQEIIEAIWSGVSPRTKLIFMSHITSPTALHLPVEEISARARQSGILTMIDGAHAPGQIPLNMETLGVDFYIGNCHKWLMAPKGSAFLFTRAEKQSLVKPLIVSWGWGEEKTIATGSDFLDNLQWWGTRDPSAYLSVPAAIEFQADHNWNEVRERCHELAVHAINQICSLVRKPSLYQDNILFHQMAIAPLPHITDLRSFKDRLYKEYSIEIPCIEWNHMQFLRISVQGYNSQSDIDRLIYALRDLLTN
jgi:isopenicillin-N epimerase